VLVFVVQLLAAVAEVLAANSAVDT